MGEHCFPMIGASANGSARSARAVFLDRDGVLSKSLFFAGKPRAPRNSDDFEIYPTAPAACRALKEAGWLIVVATNQPDIRTGDVSPAVVEAMHRRLQDELAIDAIEVCAHVDADGCDCRKPLPGMLTRAADRLGIDLSRSFMIGDRWRDIEAGRAAGCRTILVDRGWPEKVSTPDLTVFDVGEAADAILAGFGQENT
ncbi:HAD family hydrolase [Undibacter mobilis]|uniref:D,D-heptose 1,7-bisphosphate phosphatase n=2 Tax=Undibacter mobilis TaxID=2292256 RepID=A0A371B6Y7_9BRAD|nr:HAD family hydrolase [Undibacter mobilis]